MLASHSIVFTISSHGLEILRQQLLRRLWHPVSGKPATRRRVDALQNHVPTMIALLGSKYGHSRRQRRIDLYFQGHPLHARWRRLGASSGRSSAPAMACERSLSLRSYWAGRRRLTNALSRGTVAPQIDHAAASALRPSLHRTSDRATRSIWQAAPRARSPVRPRTTRTCPPSPTGKVP